MRKLLLAAAIAGLVIAPANAALPVGAKAPDFTTIGAIGGREFKFHLADQLRRGPVVVYFYPKAFTEGCTAEAHAFSAAIRDFRKAHAQVIGMSADDLKTLHRFSKKECSKAFPVATATPQLQKAFDVTRPNSPMAKRVSYAIGRDGRIAAVHDDPNYAEHVAAMLAAVKALK
jgi:peroxiredoxin